MKYAYIYADDAGSPGVLIEHGTQKAITSGTFQWVDIVGFTQSVADETWYWLAAWASATVYLGHNGAGNGSQTQYYRAIAYDNDNWPAIISSGSTNRNWSIHCDFSW